MTSAEARKILEVYRPGDENSDLEVRMALDLLRQDPALREWFERRNAFHAAIRSGLGSIQVPADLPRQILQKTIPLPRRQLPIASWAAAAAIFLLVGILYWLNTDSRPDRLTDFRARMVGTILREYRMDIVSAEAEQIRNFLRARGAPADYPVAPGLARLKPVGGGALKWRNQPVSMVCFDRGDQETLYYFVLPRSAVRKAPPPTPEFAQVSSLATATWSDGDKIYLLAGRPEPRFPGKYLP